MAADTTATPELYFTDLEGILGQLQSVSYCSGAGYLGTSIHHQQLIV